MLDAVRALAQLFPAHAGVILFVTVSICVGHAFPRTRGGDPLQKLFKDEMTRAGFWRDDAQVAVEHVEKYWAAEGHIDVTVFEMTTEKE